MEEPWLRLAKLAVGWAQRPGGEHANYMNMYFDVVIARNAVTINVCYDY